jgi:hypothetical protein
MNEKICRRLEHSGELLTNKRAEPKVFGSFFVILAPSANFHDTTFASVNALTFEAEMDEKICRRLEH